MARNPVTVKSKSPERSGLNHLATQLSVEEENNLWGRVQRDGPTYQAGLGSSFTVDVIAAMVQQGAYSDEAAEAAVGVVVVLREFEILYQRGWKLAALLAVDHAAAFCLPAPSWAAIALSDAVHRWNSAEARTLGEAFEIERAKNWNQAAAQAEAESLSLVMETIDHLRSEGKKMDQGLFDSVEELTGIGAATAKRWWYRNRRPVR